MSTTNVQDPPPAPPAKKKHHKFLWTVLALAAIIGVIVAVNGGKGTTAPAASAPVASAPAGAASGVGTSVRDGKFEFTVQKNQSGVASLGTTDFGVKPQGSFSVVTLKVANIGDQPQTFSDMNIKGFDKAGRQFSTSSSAAIYLPDNNVFLAEINPGNSVTGKIVFDVPKGSTLASVELHDSAFSDGVSVEL